MQANDVRSLRNASGLSQAHFARALNVSTVLVQAWEGGRRLPQGAALRLLSFARRQPDLLFRESDQKLPPGPATRPAMHSGTRSREVAARTVRPTTFDALLTRLAEHRVHFIVLGGVAAQLHGSAVATDDLDIVYERSVENLGRLAAALKSVKPTLRGAPGSIPFSADPRTLAHTSVLSLDTQLGPLDLRQRVAGIGEFASALAASSAIAVAGQSLRTLTLDALIASKRATGRSRDRDQVAALEQLR